MKRLFLGICLLFGSIHLFRYLQPAPHFDGAPGALAVERIGTAGEVVRESFQPRSAPYLAVYHSAGWCPPCQQFSPHLAEFYHLADKSRHRFQLVMVNYDRSEDDMLAYLRQHHMEFPAVRRGGAGAWGRATGEGIPNLVIIDSASGQVVSSSFDGTTYQGCDRPLAVLRTIVGAGHP